MYLIRMIPGEEMTVFSGTASDRAVEILNRCIRADSVTVSVYETPVFVDCGSNLEKIICPICGAEVPMDWWGEAMDTASATEFTDLRAELPCCGAQASLNDLMYDFPCGFARWVLEIAEPADEIPAAILSELASVLGEELRTVKVHY